MTTPTWLGELISVLWIYAQFALAIAVTLGLGFVIAVACQVQRGPR
jgi:hypothetical protein